MQYEKVRTDEEAVMNVKKSRQDVKALGKQRTQSFSTMKHEMQPVIWLFRSNSPLNFEPCI